MLKVHDCFDFGQISIIYDEMNFHVKIVRKLTPCWSVLEFWKIKLENSSLTNWILACKNQFRNWFWQATQAVKIQCVELDFSKLIFQKSSMYRSTGSKSHLRYTIRTLEIVNKRRIKLKLSMKVHLPHTQEPWSTIVPGKKLPLNHPNEINRLVQNSDALMAQFYQSEAVTDHQSTNFWQIFGPNWQSGLV